MAFRTIVAISDPVERASVAHDLLWNDHPERGRLRAVRGLAIREAISRGVATGEIADRLHVRVDDLIWMSDAAAAFE
ncbi:hypothetical protein [Frankia sp. Cr2]|uniref:hypothetical protein n=1 Tax=Frankia sp. Cr2 TaxID=3073932 RepID=UPI002AD342C2|nr:hypothetical protein [Frankia sp. Cr2]